MTDRLDEIRKRRVEFGQDGTRPAQLHKTLHQFAEDIAYLLAEVDRLNSKIEELEYEKLDAATYD